MSATMSALLPLAACLLLMLAGSCSAHSLFTCEPIRVHRCQGMSYNMTFFPNMMDHYDQDVAAALMEVRTCSGSACCLLRFQRVLYLYLCTYIYLIFFFFLSKVVQHLALLALTARVVFLCEVHTSSCSLITRWKNETESLLSEKMSLL